MNAAASPQSLPNPYGRIGGEIVVRAIVDRFYDLVEQDSRFVALRGIHAADLGPVRHGLTRFIVGWLGGPRDWFERGPCIMTLHRVFPVTPALADLLRVLLKAKADKADVAPRLIAATSDLDQMAAGKRDLPALAGWRLDVFGNDALRLCQGEVGLAARNGRVDIVEL